MNLCRGVRVHACTCLGVLSCLPITNTSTSALSRFVSSALAKPPR